MVSGHSTREWECTITECNIHCSERNQTLRYGSNGRAEGLDLCCVLGGRGKASSARVWPLLPFGYQAAGRCLLAMCLLFLHLAGPESLTLLHKAPAMGLSELDHQFTLWDSCLYMATLNLSLNTWHFPSACRRQVVHGTKINHLP